MNRNEKTTPENIATPELYLNKATSSITIKTSNDIMRAIKNIRRTCFFIVSNFKKNPETAGTEKFFN